MNLQKVFRDEEVESHTKTFYPTQPASVKVSISRFWSIILDEQDAQILAIENNRLIVSLNRHAINI